MSLSPPVLRPDRSSARVLLTGGAGYIGSHTAVALLQAGLTPVLLDNFCNSQPAVLTRLQQLTGRAIEYERGDVNDTAWVAQVLRRHHCQAVVHFAGLKAVGESVAQPLRYYRHNVAGLLSVLEAMAAVPDCRSLVFSSSATVYGEPASVPIKEDFPCAPQSPYAHSKRQCEQLLADVGASDAAWHFGVLRYFNPVGAHPSGLIGEDPSGVPNNLMPFLSQVAVGQRAALRIFGRDYATPDGTGVRDYLHVCDLAEGHVAALEALLMGQPSFTANLGTGQGTSVLSMLRAFEAASGQRVPFGYGPRRAGDVAAYYADASHALQLLGWRATRGLHDMCRDAWNWQKQNPQGYRSTAPALQADAAVAAV